MNPFVGSSFGCIGKISCVFSSASPSPNLSLSLLSLSAPKEEGDAYHELSEDQLRALVLYCEHDVVAAESASAERQPTAFSMLKVNTGLQNNDQSIGLSIS